MAKRKTASRKPRQAAHSAGSDAHPYRGGNSSKHASASSSPSLASSPSPQPQDLVQRRRKGTPARSPSQGDPSKGIVFTFRIQNDLDLSMAVDILSYDQIPEEGSLAATPTPALNSAQTSSTTTTPRTLTAATTATSIQPPPTTDADARAEAVMVAVATHNSATAMDQHRPAPESTVASSNLKMTRELWSSDPCSYLSSNVMDLSRNVLILHSRKPQEALASSPTSPLFHSHLPSALLRPLSISEPSTPSLTDSSSLSSSTSSSPSSSPSSPTLFHSSPGATIEKDLYGLDSLSSPSVSPLVAIKSRPSRMLSVRGLGAGARRMQVYLV